MTSIIENEVLEALIVAYEEKLGRIRKQRGGSAKSIIVKDMETILAKAKGILLETETETVLVNPLLLVSNFVK